MLSHEITSITGKHKRSRRVGRGVGSGRGKTCGRGHKGYGSRAGSVSRSLFEGGQMPLFRRLPKRGFSNAPFARRYEIVNVSELERFGEGQDVGRHELADAGLIDSDRSLVKILGDGRLTKKLNIRAHKFSKSARQKIDASGGTANVI